MPDTVTMIEDVSMDSTLEVASKLVNKFSMMFVCSKLLQDASVLYKLSCHSNSPFVSCLEAVDMGHPSSGTGASVGPVTYNTIM